MPQKDFGMQDLGKSRAFLRLQIDRKRREGTMKLSQLSCINAVLKHFGMEGCYPSRTPMETNLQLEKSQGFECICILLQPVQV